MNNIQNLNKVFEYNGCPVTFCSGDNVMINATEMAKPFGKTTKDWLRTKQAQEFIDSLSAVRHISLTGLIKIKQGGNDKSSQGTWMHEDVAIEFARWLSPQFAIWCNDRIKELLKYGVTATDAVIENLLSDPDFAIRAFEEIREERRKRIEAEKANKQLLDTNAYQTRVIEGLTKQIPLAEMRQRIVQIVQKGGPQTVQANWHLLYQEFDKKYHKNLTARMNNGGYKNKLDVIESLDMMPQLYDLSCRLFESECEELIEAWGKTIKRASRERKLLYYKD